MVKEEIFGTIEINGKTYPKVRKLTFIGEERPKFSQKDKRTAYIADKFIFNENNPIRVHKEE